MSNLKRRWMGGGALVAAAALALSACSSGTSDSDGDQSAPPAGDDTATAEEVTIRYLNFTANDGNEEVLDGLISDFESQNPGVTVDVTVMPYADYFTALQTELAGGKAPDVFDIEAANYAGYQESGVLAPIDGIDRDRFRGAIIDAYSTEGVAHALPVSFSTVVLFYNEDLFDAAGLDYPTLDWTWEDERAAAEALTDMDAGVFGDYQPISYHEFYKVLDQAGGKFLDDDGSSVAFNTPEGLAAVNWLAGKSGTVMPTAEQGAGTPDFDSGLFADRNLAMWHTGIWMFSMMDEVPFGWNIQVEPGDAQKANAVFSNAVAVSSSSEQQEAAKKLAEFLSVSPEVVQARLDASWELPPISDEEELAPYLDQGDPANRQAVFDALDNIAIAPTFGGNQAQVEDIVGEELTEVAAGRKSAQDALDSMESRINPLLGG